jgi:hypothetical protein
MAETDVLAAAAPMSASHLPKGSVPKFTIVETGVVWRRADVAVQLLLCSAMAAWSVICATRWLPGMDECWHIWFGEIDSWRLFLREISYDTHPPTLSLLVRALSAPGDPTLWARLPALVPAVATLPCFYVLCRQLAVRAPIAHLGTAIYGFSHTFVSMAVCVRAYALAHLFITIGLAALAALAHHARRPGPTATTSWGRLWWLAAAATAAAAGTLYVAVVSLLLAWAFVLGAHARARPLGAIWRDTCWPLAALAAALLAVLVFYCATCHVAVRTFIPEFVRTADDKASTFMLAGFNQNVTSFTPFCPPAGSPWPPAIAAVLFAVLLVCARRGRCSARVMILSLFPLLAILLATAGVFQVYPWGGNSRHQSVLFAPLLLSALFLIDGVYRRLTRWPRRVVVFLVAGASAAVSARSYAGPHLDDFRTTPIAVEGYAALAKAVRDGDTIHTFRFSQIKLYMRAREEAGWRWLGTTKHTTQHYDRFAARVGGKEITVLLDHTGYCLPAADDNQWPAGVVDLLRATTPAGAWLFWHTPFETQTPLNGAVPPLGARCALALRGAGAQVAEVIELPKGALLRVLP